MTQLPLARIHPSAATHATATSALCYTPSAVPHVTTGGRVFPHGHVHGENCGLSVAVIDGERDCLRPNGMATDGLTPEATPTAVHVNVNASWSGSLDADPPSTTI